MVGIGDMGAALAESALRNGADLVVFDLRAEAVDQMVAKGARAATSLQQLAEQCEAVILVVVTDKQVDDVADTLLRNPGKLRTIIVSSTILPSTVIALAGRAREKNIEVIDAPVSGAADKAARGMVTVMIGGETDTVQSCWPIFRSIGKNLYHIGPTGAGQVGKLVNNMLSLGGNMLQLEAMELARAYGISEDKVTEYAAVSTMDSRGLRIWGQIDRGRRQHTLAGTRGIYELFAKDVNTAARAAGERGVVLPIAALIGSLMIDKAMARDAWLQANGLTGLTPCCRICGQELAVPFRKAGVHPECVHEFEPEAAR